MQVYSGAPFYMLEPSAADVDIEDIAHSLASQARYAGHAIFTYSVAEHSCLIAAWLLAKYGPAVALQGLLHDAPEAYLVDLPRPVKRSMPEYTAAEDRVWAAVAEHFDLPVEMHPAVKEADNRILNDERAQAMQPSWREWTLTDERPLGVTINFWIQPVAKMKFLAAFHALNAARGHK